MIKLFSEDKEQIQRSNLELNKAREVRSLVMNYWREYHSLTDQELFSKKAEFQRALMENRTNRDLLMPRAFAVFCEVVKRTKGFEVHSNQIDAAIVLQMHSEPDSKQMRNIAEVATGEGKTIINGLCAYLDVVSGDHVHIITANDYLAERDAEYMRPIYESCGVSVDSAVEGTEKRDSQEFRNSLREALNSNIVYTTCSTIGFAYLRDNQENDINNQVLKNLDCVLIDEIDQVLLDESLTPLIISLKSEYPDELYYMANDFAERVSVRTIDSMRMSSTEEQQLLYDGRIYEGDPRYSVVVDKESGSATLTDYGMSQLNKYKNALVNAVEKETTYSKEKKKKILSYVTTATTDEFYFFVRNALTANYILKSGVDYIADENDIRLIDSSTGRITTTNLSNGLHQAIQVKENVPLTRENIESAEISRPAVFGLYKKATGVSGTVSTSYEEFRDVYGLNVVRVPSYEENRRIDYSDKVFLTKKQKMDAVLLQIEKCRRMGQPILVGTTSEKECLEYSKLLDLYQIPHEALYASNHAEEAKIIAQAGRPGAVTLATNMAGRGTDIKLGGDRDGIIEIEIQNQMKRRISLEKVKGLVRGELGNLPPMSKVQLATAERRLYKDAYNILSKSLIKKCIDKTASLEDIEYYQKTVKNVNDKIDAQIEEDKLSAEEAHGLFVLLTSKNNSRRIDDQLRGRSSRQGDPGDTRTFISLEDDICAHKFSLKQLNEYKNAIQSGNQKTVINAINNQQIILEDEQKNARQVALTMSKTDDRIRKEYYTYRNTILKDSGLVKVLSHMTLSTFEEYSAQLLGDDKVVSKEKFQEIRYSYPIFSRRNLRDKEFVKAAETGKMDVETFYSYVEKKTKNMVSNFVNQSPNNIQNLRNIMLEVSDDYWTSYIASRKAKKITARNQQYSGKNPFVEYNLDPGFAPVQTEIRRESVQQALTFIKEQEIIRRPVSVLNEQNLYSSIEETVGRKK